MSYRRMFGLAVVVIGCTLVGSTGATRGIAADAVSAQPEMLAQTVAVSLDGAPFVPVGTAVDRTEWVGNVLHVDLTLPADAVHWQIGPTDAETLSVELGGPFLGEAGFGGVAVRVRVGSDGAYAALDDFIPHAAPSSATPAPAEVPTPLHAVAADAASARSLGGPVTQAGRQPTGALSGVVVYASCGHGWTASIDSSSWILQRPILWSMNEDHGNIDQLNYFVNYAFNAGATVVPFRPVGWQDLEIVLDNDDPGVTYTGAWSDGSSSKYYENGVTNSGIVYKWTSSDVTETATARYTPTITVTDFYPVYCFAVANTNRTLQTYRVKHSGGINEVVVDHRLVGNGWIWLGDYHLAAGGDNYVEITNLSTESGAIIADAIRWGNGVGDISRPGPDSISGHLREEECMRYWAQSELGNHAVGFDSAIWDTASTDQDDNVGTGARWAAEMNQVPAGGVLVDRWKRVHLEFHTNAYVGTTRGCEALVSSTSPTTNQSTYAGIMSAEIDADLPLVQSEFEHTWTVRGGNVLAGAYGAISVYNNGNEFDSTLLEVAYHDNETDAHLLRDDRFRAAVAKSSVQGVIRFLHGLSGSTVPLAFPPDTPRNVQVVDAGNGDVTLSWIAPLTDGARGDPATGYVVYESPNGYGFGNPHVLGNVLTTTLSGLPTGETRYYRIAATNAGGESMPSEVLAVRRPDTGTAAVLIVNGFDRLRRQQNPTQTLPGGTIERQIWRRSNSFDYIVEHAEALATTGEGFASCSNEAVIDGGITLGNYPMVVWICGEESTEDATLNATEQTKLTNFLNAGGALFISGSEIAYDLDNLNNNSGRTFYETKLKSNYVADAAGTYNVTGTAGSLFADVGAFDFSSTNGAPYVVESADSIAPQTGAVAALTYVGGSGGTAAVVYDTCTYRAVTFGFPFETITSAATRAAIMQRVIPFLAATQGPMLFDYDKNCVLNLYDYLTFAYCLKGPLYIYGTSSQCLTHDSDADRDVDEKDFAAFQQAYGD